MRLRRTLLVALLVVLALTAAATSTAQIPEKMNYQVMLTNDADGFNLMSDSGRTDIEFHWVAIGRAEGNERKSEIVVPDRDEEERIQRLKEEEIRPPETRPKRPSVISAKNQ